MAVNNSLTTSEKRVPFSAVISSDGYKKLIGNTLRDPKRANRFVASIISAVATNPALQMCAPDTVISGALLGESLELSPSPQLGQYWLVPYDDRKRGCKIAQFQMGAAGYKQLAIRTGQYKDLDVIEIRLGEYKGRDKETGKHKFEFIEDDVLRETLPVVGYMAYFELLNGFRKVIYWNYDKMLAHADRYSKAFSAENYKKLQEGKIPASEMWKYSSPWYTGFDSMAEKTMLRQLISKWGLMSIEMQSAYTSDMAALDSDGNKYYPDNDSDIQLQDISIKDTESLPENEVSESIEDAKGKKAASRKKDNAEKVEVEVEAEKDSDVQAAFFG